ncbi:Vgb family protein [Patulibacter defluvii]|uniref:Vgb family protein n=1 Tax=Patulibacter defluvii TaxID=3095358 RepID=UPI002A755F04|nr:hypothetical protein [Patulibacter sp. DM4]
MLRAGLLTTVASLSVLPAVAPAEAITVTEFPASDPRQIVAATNGDGLWFTEGDGGVARIATDGTVTELPATVAGATGLAAGADGNAWLSAPAGIYRVTPAGVLTQMWANGGNDTERYVLAPRGLVPGRDGDLWFYRMLGLGRITVAGQVTNVAVPLPDQNSISGIAVGHDGNVWYGTACGGCNRWRPGSIGRIAPTGESLGRFEASHPHDLVGGPDGNLWFGDSTPVDDEPPQRIVRLTPRGQAAAFSEGLSRSGPDRRSMRKPGPMVEGPDGNLWFAESRDVPGAPGSIGRITPSGVISEFPLGEGSARTLATGPDGNLWYTDPERDRIGRISLTDPPGPADPGTGSTSIDGAVASASSQATSRRRAAIALRCSAGSGRCAGRLVLRLRARAAATTTRPARVKTITLGSARFSLAAGDRKAVVVTLNRSARRRLTSRRSLTVRATAKTSANTAERQVRLLPTRTRR